MSDQQYVRRVLTIMILDGFKELAFYWQTYVVLAAIGTLFLF